MKSSPVDSEKNIGLKWMNGDEETLLFLSSSAMLLLEMDDQDAILNHICDGLMHLVDQAIILINLVDRKSQTLTLKKVAGIEQSLLAKISSRLGIHPLNTFEMKPELKAVYAAGKLTSCRHCLAQLAGDTAPEFIINLLQKALNVNKIYSIGMVRNDTIFGGVHILTRGSDEFVDSTLIEAFILQASIAIFRTTAQSDLYFSYNQFSVVFDNLDINLYVADRLNNNVIFENKKCMDTFGDVMGSKCWNILNPHRTERCRDCPPLQFGNQANNQRRELQDQRTGKWYEFYYNLLKWSDGRDVMVMLAIDITERKQRMDDDLRNAKLEAVGLLAGGIAHDFNNILLMLSGNASIAKHHASHGDMPKVIEKIEVVEQAIARAKGLTTQFLTFSKGGEPVKKSISIENLVRESVRFSLAGSNIKEQISVGDGLWDIIADENQLSQVCNNLVINAKQAMPGGGELKIAIENVVFDNNPEFPLNRYVRLKIIDKGVGIKKDDLSRIFDPYFSTKPDGSGLGLASVHSIVAKHQGSIHVESTVNKGTTFVLYFPANLVGVEIMGPQFQDIKPSSGRILLMDDEESVLEVLSALLVMMGYSVDCTSNGVQAVALYKKSMVERNVYAAVILDLTVRGGLGGRETIAQLLQMDPAVKAIVSSGYAEDFVMANFASFGFKAILSKPYSLIELSNVLYTLTGS